VARPVGRRLRLGYLSPDFNHHAVAYFIEPVLAAHDRTRVEVFCYASVAVPDRFTDRLRGLAEHWRDIARLDDDAAAALIRADNLDLLIDLAGHSARHRLLVLARRPAPVQATWIGYPNTTGLDAIDYRITDAVSDPVGQTEAWHSEKLVRLPANFSCYRPDDDAPAVNNLPAAAAGAVTFGCFNQFAKVTPEVIALWARLLAKLPGSRLLLKSRGLGDPGVAARVQAAFAAAGVGPARLILNGDELSVADHLGLYHKVDIALDPFPYNGTTTTCEALWMGVPVVTLAGSTHVSRVGASLLTHAGLAGWIAATPDDYVARAVAAVRDLPALAALRRGLREQVRTSPLCDAVRFTRGFEAACEAMSARTV
jgi:predicted O-linked N-acetylglucosamine transferase (SPINDLY family)